jgi:hypothetical protein
VAAPTTPIDHGRSHRFNLRRCATGIATQIQRCDDASTITRASHSSSEITYFRASIARVNSPQKRWMSLAGAQERIDSHSHRNTQWTHLIGIR